jgi:polyhydroxyalkanoate synthesis regulator phasin
VDKAWQRYLEAASGLTDMTQQRAERVVKTLVKQGELAAERAEKAVDDLLKRSEQNRKVMSALVRNETEKAVARLGLARQRDLDRLERQIAQLEQKVAAAGQAAKKASASTAKKSSARKSSAKKSSAKKSSAKKSSAKKSSAKKSTSGSDS